MASFWWDVCKQGTRCLPWNPPGPNNQGVWGVAGARSDYGVPLPQGSPVQSPVNGIVLGQHPGGAWYSVFGRQSFGGEVDILTNVPEYGGLVNVGVIHMDTANVVPGQVVRKGHILGTSGGQTSGGNWPSDPQYSSGPHVGLQVHNIFNWGDLKDPGILMGNLWAGKDSSSVPTQSQLSTSHLMQTTQVPASGPRPACDFITWSKCVLIPSSPECAACLANAAADTGAVLNQAASSLCAPWDVVCLLKQSGAYVIRAIKLTVGVGILFLATLITFLPEVGAGVAIASGVPEAAPAVSQALGGRRRLPQTRTGAAVQAWSLFQGHSQRQQRQGRANVAHQAAGAPGPYPFPAGPGAPGQPPSPGGRAPRTPRPARTPRTPRTPRAAAPAPGAPLPGAPLPGAPRAPRARGGRGAAPTPTSPASPVPAPGGSPAGGGGSGGGRPYRMPFVTKMGRMGNPGSQGNPPPGSPVQRGPKTGIPFIPWATGRPINYQPVPPGVPRSPRKAAPTHPLSAEEYIEPPDEAPPYEPKFPYTEGAKPKEPSMPAPSVPTPGSAPSPGRKQPVNARERLGGFGQGRRGRRSGRAGIPTAPPPQRAAVTQPLKRPYETPRLSEALPSPFTFEEALAHMRARNLSPEKQAAKARQDIVKKHKREDLAFDDLLNDLRKGPGNLGGV